ncbi:MAG TPA: DUF255 domain-containing protein, partial [Aliiroseovarius sp.]|nr:DUF255 domain-containing protein [Aliiroseovarius sp.]
PQVRSGSGGWPNSLCLTPLGDPVFGGTYFPPDAFTSLLGQMQTLWQESPEVINAEGFRMARYLKDYLTRQAAAVDLTPELLAGISAGLVKRMDEFNGGIGTAPKFPQESLFLFLNDAARRGDAGAVLAVSAALDGMIAGGIHDQIGGGFHRYAIDPAWHVPHFEKMLYNQAMIGLLLTRSIADRPNANHARVLRRLISYLLREMRAPSGAFYAAQDADSITNKGERREGAYYLWQPAEARARLGVENGDWVNDVFDISESGDLDGANILHLPAGVPDFGRLDPLLDVLATARAKRAHPDTDHKILLGWNGAVISLLAEAAQVTGQVEYWQAGAEAARALLDGLKTPKGYERALFEGRSTQVPAQLPDLAAFGLGLIALHDFAPDETKRAPWLAEARAIAEIIRTGFGSADSGYRMAMQPEGFSPVIAIEDGELASGNAMALTLFARLARRTEAPELEIDAARLAAALSGLAAEIPDQRAGLLAAIRELDAGESGPVRYVAAGAVRVEMQQTDGELRFMLQMKPGWHINAHAPLEEYLIPTELVVAKAPLPASAYPEPEIIALGFNPQPLALYDGRLTLTAPLPAQRPATAQLTLQSCSDEICLAPEELHFVLQ